jgi:uncharacterized protein YyaL (SSP411 family)
MSVSRKGNFESKNIIRFESGQRPAYFKKVKLLLQDLRKTKEYPFCDKKIQTSWSAMMIKSLFNLGQLDSIYIKRAEKALDALMKTLYVDGELFHTTLIHKKPKVKAFLEDYAYLASSLLSAYKHTQDEMHLINAQRMINKALEKFYKNGMWNFSTGEFVTQATIDDNTYISSVSIIVDTLLTCGDLLKDEKYTYFAYKTLEYNSYNLGRKPVLYPHMFTQVLRYLKK